MQFRTLRKFAFAAAIAAAPITLSPALAATSAEVAPGMQVVDPTGAKVGLVTAIKGDSLILKTDKHEAQLPLTSFTAHQGKLMFGMTAAELDAEMDQALAAASAAVTPGAQVYGSDGTPAGTIEAIDTESVTITLTGGEKVRLPRSGVGGSEKGAVLGVTTAQLGELAGQAAAPAEATATDEDAETQ